MGLGFFSFLVGGFYVCLTVLVGVNALESSVAQPAHISSAHRRAAVSYKRHWGATNTNTSNTEATFTGEYDELVKRDGTKYVFMHHIVGNTFPYTFNDWMDDIQRIAAKGIDAIALNIGSSSWEQTQVASAYAAALASNTGIKLFYSFDLTEMPCDISDLVARTNLYANHPNQFKVNGKVFVSSYSGDCLGNSGWQQLKDRTNAYVMPFIWGLEGQFSQWPSMDSWYCWGCAWPQGNYPKNTDDDNYYISQLGGRYATTVSGWMFTHLASKNFYQRGDDWLVVSRWEQLMAMRSTLTFVEMVTWNDYGESDYYGPFKGAQPDGTYYAQAYPHTAWFDLSEYYIRAFKTGVYPTITKSTIYFWARPHPAQATASSDSLGRPQGFDWTEDSMWAAVFATSQSTVILTCGSSTQTFTVNSGVTKLKIPLAPGQMTVKMIRNGITIINYTPADFTYTSNPVQYNYNAWAGSASATNENPTSSSSSSPTSSSTPTSSAAATPTSGWSAYGCVAEGTTGSRRALTGPSTTQAAMTYGTCQNFCAKYNYAGVEFGTECYCGNTLTNNGASGVLISGNNCNVGCGGDSSKKCGGGWTMTVFSKASPSTQWNSAGCYFDSTTKRMLRGAGATGIAGLTTEQCIASCATAGYTMAGTEFSSECYCGSQIFTEDGSGAQTTGCTMPCSGNSAQTCGGGNRLNLYLKPGTTL